MSSYLNEKPLYNTNGFSSLSPKLRVKMVLKEVKRKRDEMNSTLPFGNFYAFTKEYATLKVDNTNDFRVKILLINTIKKIEKEESTSSDEELIQTLSPPKRHDNKENIFFSRQLSCDEDDFIFECDY